MAEEYSIAVDGGLDEEDNIHMRLFLEGQDCIIVLAEGCPACVLAHWQLPAAGLQVTLQQLCLAKQTRQREKEAILEEAESVVRDALH